MAWRHGDLIVAVHGGNTAEDIDLGKPDLLHDSGTLFERVGEGIACDLSRLQIAWRLRTLSEDERESWASRGVIVHGPMNRMHLGPGAVIRDGSYNTEGGDIVVGPDAEVMEGSRIRGPFALGEGSTLRMGSLVYGPTSIGRGCKVGGELSNVVIHDWSNKAHGGFLGNSVLGSWCNLGAETTCSNLKNTYGEISEWSAPTQTFEPRGRTFCGLIMGDHSKTAIHTAFSTATVIGPMSNVFGDQTPPRHLPSFSWGIGGEVCDLQRALDTAGKVMARRNQSLRPEDEARIREAYAQRA
jgi:UDP-N-acetylglucosamine diphosphorylase/glucosamine-1-phosphate N-acetyltransferase